jgi:hypothetical protein
MDVFDQTVCVQNMALRVIDRAIQAHGAKGVSVLPRVLLKLDELAAFSHRRR